MLSVKFQRLSDDAVTPDKRHEGDVGYDLYTSRDIRIPVGKVADIPTDLAVQLPLGYGARIIGRSSTIRNRRLLVVEGTVDNGYRGHLFIAAENVGDTVAYVRKGERIAQIVLQKIIPTTWDLVEILDDSDRGERGFGSTGL